MKYLLYTVLAFCLSSSVVSDPDEVDDLGNYGELPTILLDAEADMERLRQNKDISASEGTLLSRVAPYIDVSDDLNIICSLESVTKFRSMIDGVASRDDSLAVKKYKESLFKEREVVCQHYWKQKLEEAVKTLTEDEKDRMKILKEVVLTTVANSSIKNNLIFTGSKPFLDGLISFLEQRASHKIKTLLTGKSSRELFEGEFELVICDLCSKVQDKLSQQMEIYHMFVNSQSNSIVEKDDFTRDWLENIDICRVIESKSVYFIEVLHKWLMLNKL